MHIIFGKEQADKLSNKYTVLELDTFQFGVTGPVVTAYCAVETIPLEELIQLDQTRKQHADLMINYDLRNWPDCLIAIDQLKGKWRGELDTFYLDLETRIQGFVISEPPADWSPIIVKN
jgi:hypothetical protein